MPPRAASRDLPARVASLRVLDLQGGPQESQGRTMTTSVLTTPPISFARIDRDVSCTRLHNPKQQPWISVGRIPRKPLLDYLPGKSVAPMPKCAVGRRAPFPVVVDALLVRAAHDAVSHNDRERTLAFDELQDLAGDV